MTRTNSTRHAIRLAQLLLTVLLAVPFFWAVNLTPQYSFSVWIDLLSLIAYAFAVFGVWTGVKWIFSKVEK